MMELNDKEALDQIQDLMSGNEWSPDTLDAIADIVRATGREIKDINDEDEYEDENEPEPTEGPILFCRKLCTTFTDAQERTVTDHVLRRAFVGVGFPLGKTYRVPLVVFDWAWDSVAAVNRNGNCVMAAEHGRIMYENKQGGTNQ